MCKWQHFNWCTISLTISWKKLYIVIENVYSGIMEHTQSVSQYDTLSPWGELISTTTNNGSLTSTEKCSNLPLPTQSSLALSLSLTLLWGVSAWWCEWRGIVLLSRLTAAFCQGKRLSFSSQGYKIKNKKALLVPAYRMDWKREELRVSKTNKKIKRGKDRGLDDMRFEWKGHLLFFL